MGRTWDDVGNERATLADIDRGAIDYFLRKALASIAPVMTRIAEVERRQLEETTARLGDQAHNEERFDAIFKAMDGGAVPEQGIFYQNKFWDAKLLLIKFIKRAKSNLILRNYRALSPIPMPIESGRGWNLVPRNGLVALGNLASCSRQRDLFSVERERVARGDRTNSPR